MKWIVVISLVFSCACQMPQNTINMTAFMLWLHSYLNWLSKEGYIKQRVIMVTMTIMISRLNSLPCAFMLYFSAVLSLLQHCNETSKKTATICIEMVRKTAKLPLKIKNIHELHYFGVSIYMLTSLLCPLWNIMIYIWERRCKNMNMKKSNSKMNNGLNI